LLTIHLQTANMSEQIVYKGACIGHGGAVTSVATTSENPDMILTGSRGQ
jgi:guanine nucleotide-binding protein subunit beta-2-like 1 protein